MLAGERIRQTKRFLSQSTMQSVKTILGGSLLSVLLVSAGFTAGWEAAPGEGQRLRPKDVVKEYCRLDFEGARLSSDTRSQVASLIAWEEERGWDQAVIVSKYRVTNVVVRGNHATARVEFKVLGRLEGDEPFVLGRRVEAVHFGLERTEDVWKIENPIIAPHVSVHSMIQHVRGRIEHEKEGSEHRAELEEQLRQLEALGN
ncbi:MAG: hypothetical protein DMG28_03845 [Acidobacteria bacterium]|nr:MAG: hypothetical protein DMG28_03845 [Acidobacteriota bacterium]